MILITFNITASLIMLSVGWNLKNLFVYHICDEIIIW